MKSEVLVPPIFSFSKLDPKKHSNMIFAANSEVNSSTLYYISFFGQLASILSSTLSQIVIISGICDLMKSKLNTAFKTFLFIFHYLPSLMISPVPPSQTKLSFLSLVFS